MAYLTWSVPGCTPLEAPCVAGDAGCNPFVGAILYATGEPRYLAPGDLPDLILWLDGSTGVTLSGSSVTGWQGRTGNAVAFSQGSGGLQPVYDSTGINGLPAIQCDGTDDLLAAGDVAALNMSATDDWTLFIVSRPLALPGQFQALFSKRDSGGANTNPIFLGIPASTNRFSGGITTTTAEYPLNFSGGFTVGDPVLLSAVRRGLASIAGYLNGSFDSIATLNATGSIASAGSLNLCNQDATVNYFNGMIAEVAVYNRALSNSERANLECHFSSKYGLGLPDC